MNTTMLMSPQSFDELYAAFKDQTLQHAPHEVRVALTPRTFMTRLFGVDIYVSEELGEGEIFMMTRADLPR
jgi:hypothetical protein